MNKFFISKILDLNHWNQNTISFKCSRENSFQFNNGEFILIGFLINNNIIYKAYSVVSSFYDEFLEFLSIKLNFGILSKNFFFIKKNFKVLISNKACGSLIIKNMKFSKNLWLICSGTGLAPFISILKLTLLYNTYNKIFFVYTEKYIRNILYYFFFKKKFLFNPESKNYFYFYFIITRENYFNKLKFNDILLYDKFLLKINLKFLKNYNNFIICSNNDNIKNLIFLLDKILFLDIKKSVLFEKSFLIS